MSRAPTFQQARVEITLASNKGLKPVVLGYRVLNHSVASCWLELIKEANTLNLTPTSNYRRKRSDQEQEEILVKLYALVDAVNQRWDPKLILPLTPDQLTDQHLNDLHEQFERYGQQIDSANDPQLHRLMLRLNETIHTIQNSYIDQEPLRLCLVDFLPKGQQIALKPEDYMLFTSDQRWGWLYLGYNTLGKNIMAAAQDNDPALVIERRVKPQTDFSTEFQMYWMDQVEPYARRTLLHQWWEGEQLSQWATPNQTLGQWAAGYIPLAQFDQMMHAPVPTRPDTQMWNQLIWDRYDTVTDVRLVP